MGHHMTLTWGQILTLTFGEQKNISFVSSRREKHGGAIAISLFLALKLFVNKMFSQNGYFDIVYFWGLNRWPEVNFDKEIIRRGAT